MAQFGAFGYVSPVKASESYYKAILEEELTRRTERNPRYSLRAMARAFGIEASALSEILSGKRVPSFKMAQKILNNIQLAPKKKDDFLNSIARAHRSRGLQRINPIFKERKNSHPPKDLNIDLFRVIGDWFHYAILMLTYVADFRPHPKWIASQLSISEMEAKLAVKRLLELELLKEEDGTLKCWERHFTTSNKDVTTPALRRRQKQILEKSIVSLEEDPFEKRSHTAMTMAIDPEKIPEAKNLIEEFTNQMSALLESGKRREVYELHVGLIPLQKKQDL